MALPHKDGPVVAVETKTAVLVWPLPTKVAPQHKALCSQAGWRQGRAREVTAGLASFYKELQKVPIRVSRKQLLFASQGPRWQHLVKIAARESGKM